jgi:DNA-binding beta-propeller fold protein YncE
MFVPAVEAALAPPSAGPPLVVQLVDAMHYQRPESVILVLWVIAVVAIVAGIIVAVGRPSVRILRTIGTPMLIGSMCIALQACGDSTERDVSIEPLRVSQTVGGPGTAPGRFVSPRAASAKDGVLVVIDRSGRLQRIGDTVVETQLPLLGTGFPTGVHLCDDGLALVADTHGSRVLGVTQEGDVHTVVGPSVDGSPILVSPTDVLQGPDGLLYVSEYGDVDRIAVCTNQGALVRSLGSTGTLPGQFRRPQAMAFNAAGQLWVADACNHRLQLIDPHTGAAIAVIDDLVRYPYGIDVLANGDLLVGEYGGNVLRRIDPKTGRNRAWGGWGDGPGQLRTPWSVAIDHNAGVAWLVDTGHDRVLGMELEALAW